MPEDTMDLTEVQKTMLAFQELLTHVGIMDAAVINHEIPHVEEGWTERLEYYQNWAKNQMRELHEFAEEFDEGPEDYQ